MAWYDNRPHTVYRCYDTAGHLLYVGMTHRYAQRMAGHRSKSGWMSQVRRIELAEYPDRASAARAEIAAIAAESPAFNRSHNGEAAA